MVALNPEWFTQAPDNTTEELLNGAKDINTSLSVLFWLSVWKMWCKDHSFGNQGTKMGSIERFLEKFCAKVKNITFCHFLHASFFMFILLIINHMIFPIQFGIRLPL